MNSAEARWFKRSVYGLALFALVFGVASCGGGGGGSAALPPGGSSSAGTMTVTLSIPAYSAASSKTRNSQSVPSSILGLTVYAYLASGTAPTTATLVGDLAVPPLVAGNKSLCVASGSNRTCTITFTAPVGSDIVSVQLYDQEPVSGAIPASANLVASGMTSFTVSANGTNQASITLNSVTASISGASGGSLPPLSPTATATISGGNVMFSLPAGAASGNVSVGVSEVLSLTIPLSTQRHPLYTAGAGNTMVYAFGVTFLPALTLSSSMSLTGTTFQIVGSLASALSSSGTLSVAELTGNTYTDVGSLNYTFSGGTLTITGGTAGIVASGIYVIYIPAAGTSNVGSSSASSTGAVSVLTVAGTTYAFVPTSSGLLQVPLTNSGGTSLASSSRSGLKAVTGQGVDACAADSVHSVIYCIQFSGLNGANIYAYNVSSGSLSAPTTISTNASQFVSFSGGSCVLCGIVYDGIQNDLIVSANGAYLVCPTSGSCATPLSTFSTVQIAENFGYNASSRLLFSPYYGSGNYSSNVTTGVQLISLASGTSGVYSMSSVPSGLAGPDHGAIDVGTGIGVTTNECNSSGCGSTSTAQSFLFGLGSAALNSSNMTFTAQVQPFTLTSTALSACPYAVVGIAIDSNAHYAFFTSEFCQGVIGVAKLPTTSGGLANGFSDWVFADMPAPPNSSYWSDNEDPHALTVFSLPGACADCAVISNFDKSYLAVIDLNQFFGAARTGDGHTVATSTLTATPASGNPVVTFVYTSVPGSCQSACSSSRSPAGIRIQHH